MKRKPYNEAMAIFNAEIGPGAPRCSAHSRRTGQPCKQVAMWNPRKQSYGRCRMHGGIGPRSSEALDRSVNAPLKSGSRTAVKRQAATALASIRRQVRELEQTANPDEPVMVA